jgi:hypothetical protein
MDVGGWIMLGLMWGGVISLLLYCFIKILTSEKSTEL